MLTNLPSAKKQAWQTLETRSLTAENLDALFRNEIPLIRVERFVSEDETASLVKYADSIGFHKYRNVVPVIDRIGVTVFEFDKTDPAMYFAKAREVSELQSEIFGKSFSPLERVMDLVRSVAPRSVSIASSDAGESYYAGLVRRIESGTELHIDFAPAEHPRWEVGRVESQLAWNIYLEVNEAGCGATTVYNRPWDPEDDAHKNPDGYGYLETVFAEDPQSVTFRPKTGDLYLFNTRNYHIVESSKGHRTTAASAVGRFPTGDIVFWS